MLPVLLIVYAFYVIAVGVKGNGTKLITQIETEKQFLYWVLVIFILAALWESPYLSKVAKPLAVLVILGFLVHKGNNGQYNFQTVGTNAKQFLSGL